ncbi:hypothetical protein TIFTF001_003998 [Ficus carica]|uniref:Uncharacterized protein n=1 Tax=Ficus carica TaxID=3494 RepID=A0AA87ZG66_FICCA|nr:hypothetical protein TIFTF001_003998 [Ficus carica]
MDGKTDDLATFNGDSERSRSMRCRVRLRLSQESRGVGGGDDENLTGIKLLYDFLGSKSSTSFKGLLGLVLVVVNGDGDGVCSAKSQ